MASRWQQKQKALCFSVTLNVKRRRAEGLNPDFTLDLDVFEQHRFDLFPPNQDAGGPPVQDVHTQIQTHLRAKTGHGQVRQNKYCPLLAETGTDTYCVRHPFPVVRDFYPLLVVTLGYLLTLLVLDLDT